MKKITLVKKTQRMERTDFVLAVLSTANGVPFRPVQVQKLFFLIDQEIANEVGGKYFDFQPYNYGPFDSEVYQELDKLTGNGDVEIVREYTWKNYRLTPVGQSKGKPLFDTFSPETRNHIAARSEFVRNLGFTQLVSAIYQKYPAYQANSIFKG